MNHAAPQTPSKLVLALPSMVGLLLFIVPFEHEGRLLVPIALLARIIQTQVEPYLALALCLIVIFSGIMGVLYSWLPRFAPPISVFKKLFVDKPIWVFARLLGAFLVASIYFKAGPNWIWSDKTGGLIFQDLLPVLISVFLCAGLLLPLLVNFGLMEFCGTFLTGVMQKLFRLPGRSAVDCLASWVGDGTVGVMLTNQQYEEGLYTQKEAAVIGTTFSFVSITFALVILSYMQLEAYFFPYMAGIVLVGIACAIICPRIPPLSNKSDLNIFGRKIESAETSATTSHSKFHNALDLATNKARENWDFQKTLFKGIHNVMEMWFIVVPSVLVLGTLALLCAEYTPLFQWLGTPLIPILQWAGVVEAEIVSQTIFIGFADMFLPAVLGASATLPITKFIIASISVSQLIYMSEVGGLLLASSIPVKLSDLVAVFFIRTAIALPIILVIAKLVF